MIFLIDPIYHNNQLSIAIEFMISEMNIDLALLHQNIIFIVLFFLLHLKREHYFASAAWVSQTEVSVVWMNRAQNLSIVTLCKSPMWYCQEVSAVDAIYFVIVTKARLC